MLASCLPSVNDGTHTEQHLFRAPYICIYCKPPNGRVKMLVEPVHVNAKEYEVIYQTGNVCGHFMRFMSELMGYTERNKNSKR